MTENDIKRQMMISSEIRNAIKNNIRDHGWHACAVSPSEGDSSLPFCYTIGLTDMGMPEIILIGAIQPRFVHTIFSTLIEQWKENGVKTGLNSDLIVDKNGNPICADIVELNINGERLKGHYALQAYGHYGKDANKMRFVQVHWPDMNGRLPTTEGFAMSEYTEILEPSATKFEA